MTEEEAKQLKEETWPATVDGVTRPTKPITVDMPYSEELPQMMSADWVAPEQPNTAYRQLLSNDKAFKDGTVPVATATKLQTARTISLSGGSVGEVAFDGSKNVNISTTTRNMGSLWRLQRDRAYSVGTMVFHEKAPSWSYLECVTAGTTSSDEPTFSGLSEGDIYTDGTAEFQLKSLKNANKLTTARTISLTGGVTGSATFDGSANASIATTIAGTAPKATQLATARTISLTGDATGSTTFNGTANASINTVNLSMANLYRLKRNQAYSKGSIAFWDSLPTWAYFECTTAGTTASTDPTLSNLGGSAIGNTYTDGTAVFTLRCLKQADSLVTPRTIALTGAVTGSATFDGSANASIATTIAGTAPKATKLATARTISLTGGVTGSVSFDGSANASIATTIAGNAPTATKLATARTISLTGEVTGSASFDGTKNVSIATTGLIGKVEWFAGSTTPTGYLICDGSAVSRTTYAKLYAVIGTTYGTGDGSTTFNLPNLIDKFVQGSKTVGTKKNAGLPNIIGHWINDMYYVSNGATGAYTVTTHGTDRSPGYNEPLNHGYADIYFNAQKSNSIYGNSTTVQPPALTLKPLIRYI